MGRYALLMGVISLAVVSDGRAQRAPGDSNLLAATSRIRPTSDFATGVIIEGVCRSATLRSLVDTLQASDVITYVTMRTASDQTIAGGLEFLGATTTDRIVRIVIGLPLDRIGRMAMLGHELQHATEVAANPGIRNRQTFDAFYRSHGIPGATEATRETEAARRVESRVRAEVSRGVNPCTAP